MGVSKEPSAVSWRTSKPYIKCSMIKWSGFGGSTNRDRLLKCFWRSLEWRWPLLLLNCGLDHSLIGWMSKRAIFPAASFGLCRHRSFLRVPLRSGWFISLTGKVFSFCWNWDFPFPRRMKNKEKSKQDKISNFIWMFIYRYVSDHTPYYPN